ncbi:MAG TPA: Hsp70 family protein [Actinoplanes sp.]|nr:Hsp70 family protein [Actinoplanes sp.]
MSIDQGGPKRYALGVDFGTSNTVAVARWPDGRARPILVDGSPLLPSAVFADSDGTLLVGRDAVHSARLEPARFEPNPKRRVDDGLILLGEREFEIVEVISAVLARVAEEWHRAVGPYRPEVTLTCPAAWGATRRTLLAEAAARAGLEGARLVAEPVAAATYFAEVLGRDVPIGSVVVVHDFGAGTFDASVVARTSSGFEVLAVDGRDDLGGLDVDAAIVEHLRTDDWARLTEPATVEERRARRQLWDDVRIAKERLSRAQSADFVVPLLDVEAHLTREELETVARPVLEQTVQVTRNILRWADLPDGKLAGVFLVGGASRIPLVSTLLHRALGDPPVVIEQPELVVAEGSILAGAALLTTEPAAPGPTEELRLPSKYLPAREAAPVAEKAVAVTAERPTVVAPRPVDDRPTVLAAQISLDDRATVLAAQIDLGDRATAMAALENRPTAVAPRPATTPVPAVPSEQEPEAGWSSSELSEPPQPDALPKRKPQPERGPDTPAHLRPPVDPWPDAVDNWRPDPDATVATSPPEHTPLPENERRVPVPPRGRSGPPPHQKRPAQPAVVAHARPISPAVGSARPVSPPGRAVVAPAAPVLEAAQVHRPRRRGRALRAIQILFSVAVMITVPVVALVLAYGYGNAEPIEDDAINVFRDILELLGLG